MAKAVCKEAFDKLDAHVEVVDCKALKGMHTATSILQNWSEYEVCYCSYHIGVPNSILSK